MKQEITIGAAPTEEGCAQLGSDDYQEKSQLECRVFKRMLERLHPIPENVDVRLQIKSERHEFGAYREVCVRFEDTCEVATTYAYELEAKGPTKWDPIAQYELTWFMTHAAYQRGVAEGRITTAELPQQYAQALPPGNLDPTATFSQLLQAHPL